MLGSFQIVRERFHSNELVQSLVMTDPQVATRIQQLGGAYARVLTDPILRQAQGSALLSQQVTRSEEHTSELQSLMRISYAVFCLKKKKTKNIPSIHLQ